MSHFHRIAQRDAQEQAELSNDELFTHLSQLYLPSEVIRRDPSLTQVIDGIEELLTVSISSEGVAGARVKRVTLVFGVQSGADGRELYSFVGVEDLQGLTAYDVHFIGKLTSQRGSLFSGHALLDICQDVQHDLCSPQTAQG